MKNYEKDVDAFPADAYRVKRWGAVAFDVLGWETEPDADTEWSGYEARTGRVLAVMIGDDKRHSIDPDDLIPIAREEYCGSCGQIGCTHDRMERE